jgi:peptide/nickel transport system substrate-binding protein
MRRVPAIVACLLATALLASPALADNPSRDLRMATTAKIETLNPLVGTLESEYRVWALNYDLLISFDQRTMKPDLAHSLAKEVDTSPDGLTWTYHLGPGLHWSDGAPLTSHDVAWTMNFMKRRTHPAALQAVKSWKATNKTTVVAKLTRRSNEMRSLWISILPKHIWKRADTDDWEEFQPPLPLVGSGPYSVTQWKPNGTTVLERNPEFRRDNGGPQRVLMTYYPDPHGAVTDLEQNRLDVMPSATLDPPDAQQLQRSTGVQVFQSPALSLEYWVFNLAPYVTPRVHKDVVRSRAIRTALAWAIDRSQLVQAAVLGYGSPGNTQVPRSYGELSLDLSDDPTLGYHYDPARARRILDQSGWRVGSDGVRSKDGVRAELELAYAGESSEKRAVELIRSWAKDVGIEIDVRVYGTGKLLALENNTNGTRLQPDFDTQLWSIDGDPTPEFLLSLFTRAQIGVWNDSGFTNPRYEELYRSERQENDPAARESAIHQLQRIATMHLPYIELYEADDISAVNTRTWSNWTTQPSPDGQPITSYGYDTVIALHPGTLASPSYPGVPWALAGLVLLAVLAAGSSYLAHRREQREPLEVADAAA